jgi:NAD(P)-dependent dehydrogenase (short-subunit alcohol dehydrogenase family)
MERPGRVGEGMESFEGKLAIVTGGGSGMGRELVRQLAGQGCRVATCDVNSETVAETAKLARAGAAEGVTVTGHTADVSNESQVLRFRDELLAAHQTSHVDLVFSNAGIGGGASFVKDPREEWERVFAVNWQGVYYCARAFMPLLIQSPEGVLVNTSSINGFFASLGAGNPQTAYSTSKFAVKGFSEALIEDLRVNAPHVRVMLVMPGHVGTNIVGNSLHAHGMPDPASLTVEELEGARQALAARGLPVDGVPAAELGQVLAKLNDDFRDSAPLTAAAAATIILDGVRSGAWRVLVGEDAKLLDTFIRANPERTYDYDEMTKALGGDPALSAGSPMMMPRPVSSATTRSDSRRSKVIISRSAPSPSPAFGGDLVLRDTVTDARLALEDQRRM